MLHYSMRLDEANKTLADIPELSMYEKFYGFSNKDMGLYALSGHELVGAAWIRLLKVEDGANGYVDTMTPILNIAVKPAFRGEGIGYAMLEQLFVEVAAVYESISLSVASDSDAVRFFERCGFVPVDGNKEKSLIDGSDVITMIKKLQIAEINRPSDGYDPRRWMD